jgi:hypothetical protein
VSNPQPRGFAANWAATVASVRTNDALLWPVAAAFFFLPQLLLRRIVGEPLVAIQAGEVGVVGSLVIAGATVVSLTGQLTVTHLLLRQGEDETLAQSLRTGLALLLPGLAALILQSMAIGAGLLLLIVPGLYLAARLLFVFPALMDRHPDPVAALRESWRLTDGSGLRILAQMLALLLGFILLSLLMSGLGSALGVLGTVASGGRPAEGEWGIGRWLYEMAGTALSAAFITYYLAFAVSLYRSYR